MKLTLGPTALAKLQGVSDGMRECSIWNEKLG